MQEYKKRLSVDISPELHARMERSFEWGEVSRVMRNLLTYACERVEKEGRSGLGDLLRLDDECLPACFKERGE